MAATLELVTDQMLSKFKTHWDANAPAAVGGAYNPKMLTEADQNEHPNDQEGWCRVSIRHSSVGAGTLGGIGQRRITRYGFIYVQIFAPALDGQGFTIVQRLAQVARDAYEGERTEDVWFGACRLNEQGRDGPWMQINLAADFQWEEVK
jgi:hypothetical protein